MNLYILKSTTRLETPYWRPNAAGYASDLREAGLYTSNDAERYAADNVVLVPWREEARLVWGHPDRWPHMEPGSVGATLVQRSASEGWPSGWLDCKDG